MGLGEAIARRGRRRAPGEFRAVQRGARPAVDRRRAGGDRHRVGPPAQAARRARGVARHRHGPVARSLASREVVHHLDLVLPTRRGARGTVSNAAIVQARDQLGAAPLAALFTQTATDVGPRRGRRPSAGAGWPSTASTAPRCASPTRRRTRPHFGRAAEPRWRGRGGYPQLRLVALMVLRAHLLAGAAFGAYRTSELALATHGLGRSSPSTRSSSWTAASAATPSSTRSATPDRDRHWLVRARSGPTALTPARRRALRPRRCPRRAAPQPRDPRASIPTCRPRSASAPSASSAAASAPYCSSPRCSIPSPIRPPSSSRSTTSAGNSNSPSTKLKTHTLRARRGAAQQGARPRRAGSVGAAARLQPRPPRHGRASPARRRAARCASAIRHALHVVRALLAHRVGHVARARCPGASRRLLDELALLRPARAAAAPLPARRQDQDEQLSAQSPASSEVSR